MVRSQHHKLFQVLASVRCRCYIIFSASVFCSVGILFRFLVVGWLLSVVCVCMLELYRVFRFWRKLG